MFASGPHHPGRRGLTDALSRRRLVIVMLWLVPMSAAAQNVGLDDLLQDQRSLRFSDLAEDTVFLPVNINNWWGYMDQRGDLVVWPAFDWTDYEFEGMLRVIYGGRTGYLNRAVNWQIEPRFAWADRFAEGMAIVREGDGYSFINKAGTMIVPPRLTNALRFNEGYAAVQVENRCGFIDKRGELVIPLQYQKVRSFHDGMAAVQLPAEPGRPAASGRWQYINKTGRTLFSDTQGQFSDVGDFKEGLARVRLADSGKVGFINKRFRLSIPARFDDADDFVGGVAPVRIDRKWGYIDKTGRVVIPFELDQAERFTDESMGLVRVGEYFGFLGRAGHVRVEPIYEDAYPFFRRFARVKMDPSFGYIGVTGRLEWDPNRANAGIVDRTRRQQIRLRVDLKERREAQTTQITPPPPRDAPDVPYHPEFRYVDELPKPW